jgi:hypothetical protein
MDQEKLVSQAAITVPIIHVITCAIYLAGYSAGFGAHVGTLFSVGDLFGLSVADLFWIYLAGCVIPLIALSPQLKPGYKSAITRARETGDQSTIGRHERQERFYSRLWPGFFGLFFLFLLFDAFICYKTDQRIPYMELSQPIAFGVSRCWAGYAATLPTKRSTDLLVAVVMTLGLVSFATGVTRGQGERRYAYETFSDARPRCGDWVVLQTVGDRMIASNRTNIRAVITEECKAILVMPLRPAFKQATLAELISEWWRSSPRVLGRPERHQPGLNDASASRKPPPHAS